MINLLMLDLACAFGVAWLLYLLWKKLFFIRDYKWVKILVYSAFVIAASMPLQGGDIQNAFFILVIFMCIGIFATCDRWSRKVAVMLILYAIMLATKMLAVRSIWMFHYDSDFRNMSLWLELMILYGLYRLLKDMIPKAREGFSDKVWLCLMGVALATVGMVVMSMIGLSYIGTVMVNAIVIVVMLICLSSITSIFFIMGEIAKGANEAMQRQALEYELAYYEDVKLGNEHTRKLLHDMKNHMGTIGAMLKVGEQDEAVLYIEEVVGALSEEKSIIYCKHQAVNAILHNKVKRMQQLEITYSIACDLPEAIHLSLIEIGSIVNNTLDNAIEACMQVEDKLKREIQVKVRYVESQLLYEVENTKAHKIREEAGKLKTSKEDKLFHGHGIGQIESIVHKHKGLMDVVYDEARFKITVIV
ncbi:MAG: sensor histidine kinase [Cellulosilyticaceae bacterium]